MCLPGVPEQAQAARTGKGLAAVGELQRQKPRRPEGAAELGAMWVPRRPERLRESQRVRGWGAQLFRAALRRPSSGHTDSQGSKDEG